MSAMRTRLTTPSGCRDLPADAELHATYNRIATSAGFSDRPDFAVVSGSLVAADPLRPVFAHYGLEEVSAF